MLGKFDDGQDFGFYAKLTDHILDLVRSIKARDPHALNYRGMDLSHAFESQLYFDTVSDATLNELYVVSAKGLPAGRGARLHSRLAELLAVHWFGREYVRHRCKPGRLPPILRRALTIARSFGTPGISEHMLPPVCDVLFYARSMRFADYLMPVARAFSGRCAFLVLPLAHDVQSALKAADIPFITAADPGLRVRPLRAALGSYASSLAVLADGIERALLRVRPRVVLVAEGNSPDDEVINRVGRKLGIPVACLQQGWSPIVHPGFCNLSYDTMMMWGPGFGELLAPYNPLQQFVATGNHALSAAGDDVSKKTPGVIFFHQDVDRGLGGKRGSEMMLALAERIAGAKPDLPVYVRPHPLVPLDAITYSRLAQWPNLAVQNPADVPLADALAKASVSVSIYSTTILESVAVGTVPLIFNMTSMPHFWPDVAAEGAGVEVHTLDEAFAALMRLLLSDEARIGFAPAMARFSERHFVARGGKAVGNIVAELKRLANVDVTPG